MINFKSKAIIFILLGLLLVTPFFVNAQEKTISLYFFYSETCPHCHEEVIFLANLKKDYGSKVEIFGYEVTGNRANAELFKKFGEEYEVSISSVPLLFIGEKYIIGYGGDDYSGKQIKNLVDQYLKLDYHDLGRHILYPDEKCEDVEGTKDKCEDEDPKIIKVPLIGEVNLQNVSLFVSTIVLGGLDGFNPCAMWVLIFLISLLLSIDSAKRRWILGLTFIVASGLVYYLFLAAWLNLFLFIGYLLIVRIIIGVLAISFGIYALNKFCKNKSGTCEVTNTESRQKVLEKLKNTALKKNLLPALIGIIILGFVVNLIELACSAGFPAIYTKILASQNLPTISYYLYLLFYVIIFMLDDIIVFAIAMITLKVVGVDAKYSRYSNLIGGVIILILGLLLIFKPTWLMF